MKLKATELKPLDRAGRLFFGLRASLRVWPWLSEARHALWEEHFTFALAAASEAPVDEAEAGRRRRALLDAGARDIDVLAQTDDTSSRCGAYALYVLGEAVVACSLPAGTALTKQVLAATDFARSIPAMLAHAGRAVLPKGMPPGQKPIEVVLDAFLDELRADVGPLALATPALAAERDLAARRTLLTELRPLLTPELRKTLGLGDEAG